MVLNRDKMLLVTLALFTFFEGRFFFKSCRKPLLQFYGVWGSKILNFLVTLNDVRLNLLFFFKDKFGIPLDMKTRNVKFNCSVSVPIITMLNAIIRACFKAIHTSTGRYGSITGIYYSRIHSSRITQSFERSLLWNVFLFGLELFELSYEGITESQQVSFQHRIEYR